MSNRIQMKTSGLMATRHVLELNLSYVLHEASSCRNVRRLARRAARFGRDRSKLTGRFDALTEREFVDHLVIRPPLDAQIRDANHPLMPVSLSVGLPDLIPRLLHLDRRSTFGAGSDPVRIDQPESGESEPTAMLFRSPARLAPPPDPEADEIVLVIVAVVRPGGDSIMLDGAIVEHDRDWRAWTPEALELFERLIRENAGQWTPETALWDKPAECTLPGLKYDQPSGPGDLSCGS